MLSGITADASFTRMEEEVRRFWQVRGLPQAFAAVAAGSDEASSAQPFVIYQHPLGVEQSESSKVQLLSTADLVTRFRTMRREPVHCQTGWSSHGLPLEVAVETSIGRDTADHDVARFSAACLHAAIEGIRQDEALAERLGVWLNPESTYASLTPAAIGAVWGVLRRLWTEGRLHSEIQIVNTCTRCATPLSAAEAKRLLVRAESISLWLQLPWDGEPDAYFLVWVPFPWMLAGMVALAVHPEARYVLVEAEERTDRHPLRLVVAEATLGQPLLTGYSPVRQLSGKSLRGVRYHPAFTFVPAGDKAHRIVLSADVPLDHGTGLLPVTPAFHTPSLALAHSQNLPISGFLDERDRLDESAGRWRGLTPLEAEPHLIDDMEARGLLFRRQPEIRTRALCPYCETPLLPTVRSTWEIDTPEEAWLVGRDRIWGTPLPIWTCDRCGVQTCLAGLDDLSYRTGIGIDQIDPHRPAIDGLTFPCEACTGKMHREPFVVDAAFDSAVLPWAVAPQLGAADVAIGFEQKPRDWLGDLAMTSNLVRGKPAWSQAIALQEATVGETFESGHFRRADAWRWAAYSGTTPEQAERAFLRPLWRSVVQILAEPETKPRKGMRQLGTGDLLLDNWLSARTQQTVNAVTAALENCEVRKAADALARLVDDFVAWYVPRRPGSGREPIETLARLAAPFAPHLAEVMYSQGGNQTAESVHLSEWPTCDPGWQEPDLLRQMASVQRLAALGQEARARSGIEPDKPLREALIGKVAGGAVESDELALLANLLAEVLGVQRIGFPPDLAEQVQWQLAFDRSRNMRQEFTADQINSLLAALSPETTSELALQLQAGLSVRVSAAGQGVTLLPDEVIVTPKARKGWSAAVEATYVLLLKTN